jgi:hypothetical protein
MTDLRLCWDLFVNMSMKQPPKSRSSFSTNPVGILVKYHRHGANELMQTDEIDGCSSLK